MTRAGGVTSADAGQPVDNQADAKHADVARAAWRQAVLAAELFAIDPARLGGIVVTALAGPVRDRWLDIARGLLPSNAPVRKVPLNVTDERLLGGLDLAATLATGRAMAETGLLAEVDGGVVIVPMAERMTGGLAARLTAALDQGRVAIERDGLGLSFPSRFGVIALDERMSDDEATPAALRDRLAIHCDLRALSMRDAAGGTDEDQGRPRDVITARARLAGIVVSDDVIEALVGAAAVFGIASLRAPMLAVAVARASAALAGRPDVTQDDLARAVGLVLAPRATRLPPSDEQNDEQPDDRPEDPENRSEPDAADQEPQNDQDPRQLEDMLIEAVRAALPAALLAQLQSQGTSRAKGNAGGKSGVERKVLNRGRPIGVSRRAPRGGARLDLVATLRAAAPWQQVRRNARAAAASGSGVLTGSQRVEVRNDDFRTKRFRQHAESTTIFAVDASGSTALDRLAEAKGAVELLLADCYVRRDQVALIAFRGKGAELLLPPSRSLVRAKRCLASLPGGGGTPLASGIDAARALAEAVARKGQTPVIVLLTDGRANVGRTAKGGRPAAEADAKDAARALGLTGTRTLVIDTSPRSEPFARTLADAMRARYIALPYASSHKLSEAVRAEIQEAR